MIYLLDTNIISYIIKGNMSIKSSLVKLITNGNEVHIPAVAYYEAKRGLLATGATAKLERFMHFVNRQGIVNTTITTYDTAAQIYSDLSKAGKLIEDADIFIGATALEHNAVLITNNEQHLSHIKNLQIEVWH